MAGKVLNLTDVVSPDDLGCRIAQQWMTWNTLRQNWITEKEELRKYVYATDTTTTTNSQLPWKNKTTIPKLCQIRDNLDANYMASLFPKRNWFTWDAETQDANQVDKRDVIINYTRHATSQDRFKTEMRKCVLDYIDYGNAFGTVEWTDQRQTLPDMTTKVGYVGWTPKRISPLDIVFNPVAPSFYESPKIIRSLVSFGEVKALLESMSTPENKAEYEELFQYLKKVRTTIQNTPGDFKSVDDFYRVDGFTSFRNYMLSDFVEILTFYGDIYDWQNDKFYKNHQIMVVDRHKILGKPRPNPSFFGFPPIFHVGWRPRQDNLWAMGPLDNLVGMQYRLDHVENLKADTFDLLVAPPLKIKGYVEDFEWAPMERIYTGDDGDVNMVAPPFQILQANQEIGYLVAMMEEMAGAPKEAMGFRTPGEKTAYEVQRLENAAARIFTNKIVQFEEQFVERILNAGLELSRRNISEAQTIAVFDDDFNIQTFLTLTAQDITGAGKLKPVAARHFAEQAEIVQNITNFANSKLGMDPAVQVHFSSVKLAKLFEDLLNIKDYEIVQPYVRLSEQADAAKLQQAHSERVGMAAQQPAGLTPDDHDPDLGGNGPPTQPPQAPPGAA
jgi:hypothetical protein